MAAELDEILLAMLRRRRRWDEAPALHILRRLGGKLHASPMSAVPDRTWEGRPPYALAALASAAEKNGSLLSGGPALAGFAGAVFRFECWRVIAPDDPALAAQARIMQQNRRLYQHPDRVEQRMAHAVLADGTARSAFQCRDGDATMLDDPGSGLVPDSLSRLVRALSRAAATASR